MGDSLHFSKVDRINRLQSFLAGGGSPFLGLKTGLDLLLYLVISVLHADFSGLKIQVSWGCNLSVLLGGRHIGDVLLLGGFYHCCRDVSSQIVIDQ